MEWVSGNIFIRAISERNAGDRVDGHTHTFDHTTILFSGAVCVRATLPSGRVIEREFTAPAHFLIRKDVTHEITALKDGTTYWCVYAHRDRQGDVVQEYSGWGGAYV
jgi:hypothetical protein